MFKAIVAVAVFSLTLFQTIGEVSGTETTRQKGSTRKVSAKETTTEVSGKRTTRKVSATETTPKVIGEEVVLGKVCDGKIAIAQSSEPFAIKEEDPPCVTVAGKEPNVFQKEKREILNRLNRKSIALGAESESAVKELDYFDDALVKALLDNYSLMEKTKEVNKDYLFNIIDPDTIRFMFQLSSDAYYKTDFGKNEKNISTAYMQDKNSRSKVITKLKGTLEDIADLRKIISDARQNTVVRLKGTKTEAEIKTAQEQAEASLMKGSQGQGVALKHKAGEGSLEFEHEQSSGFSGEGVSAGKGKAESIQTRTEAENLQITSLARDVIKSIREEYRLLFREELPETAHLADIKDRLDALEEKTENDLIEQERVQSILSDPRIGAYWTKLELTYAQEATNLVPIDILYRNLGSYKSPILGLANNFIKSKDQPLSIIDNKKELSGVIMYKEGNKSGDKDEGNKSDDEDEIIIAFSGSKSQEDWKHNFDAFRQSGEIGQKLGAGKKTHRGIFQSLSESLDEAGTNLRFWLGQYLKNKQNLKREGSLKTEPTLKFTITGHSLGGGLALLMATWVNDNIKNKLFKGKVNVEIKVYTFGAPPIFKGRSAETVENELGKANIIRVWNIGDPVANLSLLRKEFKDQDPSVVMYLTQYRHVGISVPLYDPEHLLGFFDKIHPWKNHVSDTYFNLIHTGTLRLLNDKINLMEKRLKDHKYFSNKIYQDILDKMITFIKNPSDNPVNEFPLAPIPFKDFKNDILEEESKAGKVDLRMSNYEEIKKQRVEKGISASPELKRSKIEKNEIGYNHKLMSMTVPMKVNRSTSCEFSALKKKVNSKLKKDEQIGVLRPEEQSELSCVCCLAKNFILTNQTIIERTKKYLKGKKISTVSETIAYCDKYCQPLKDSGILKTGSGDVASVRQLLKEATGEDINEAFGAIELKPVK